MSTNKTEPEFYLKKHHVMPYIEDAMKILLERKDDDPKTRPYELLAEYFESVKKGTHVIFREYSFICLTPHNRSSFIRLFWHSYSGIAGRGDCMNVKEYLSLVRLLCYDFSSDVVHEVARVLFSYDAKDNLISFSDFIYTFQTLFYYEPFLKQCESISVDLTSGQAPHLNLLAGMSTMVVSVPSTAEHTGRGTETAQSVLPTLSSMKDHQINGEVFSKALTRLCMRGEKEPWERCPNIEIMMEVIARLPPRVTYYDFVLALSKNSRVSGEIGVLPDRTSPLA